MCTTTSTSFSAVRRRIAVIVAFFCILVLIMVLPRTGMWSKIHGFRLDSLISSAVNEVLPSPHRKLLVPKSVDKPTRFWDDTNKCTESDIQINQGPGAPLPSGIPTYTVEIANACLSGCDISHIHIRCGWFSSAHTIDPLIFMRVRFNDCLLNGGGTLKHGTSISFQYANSYSYPLSVFSMRCSF
ncbi:unnamed protein product [Amaranthus hypochondriacus]